MCASGGFAAAGDLFLDRIYLKFYLISPPTLRTEADAMAEIGRLLSLPPPAVPGRPGAIQPAGQPGAGQPGAGQPGAKQAGGSRLAQLPATGNAVGGGIGPAEEARDQQGNARAKAFRFRVYDGGRPDEGLAGNAGVPARDAAAARPRGGDAAGEPGPAGASRRAQAGAVPAGSFSAPFLTQLIAQEQLRPGLYDPPLKAADRAYRQAGGEPALADGGVAARFRMAV
jgi:hypothetical protein